MKSDRIPGPGQRHPSPPATATATATTRASVTAPIPASTWGQRRRGLTALVTGLAGIAGLAAGLLPVSAAAADASKWPTKPIVIVNGYPPGGDSDVIARIYADKLTGMLGQPVLIENRAGASGTIAASHVARSQPDGYTLLFAPSTFAIAQLTLKPSAQTAHDVIGDFTPIIKTGDVPLLAVTSPSSGYKDLKGIVAAAKSGKTFTYGTPGAGSPMHVVGELLNKSAGIELVHVPYRGVAPVVNDALGGHIVLGWITPAAAAQYVTANKMIPLAIGDKTRDKLMPDVPTLTELGYPEAQVSAWMALLGPKNLPEPIATRLNKSMNEILAMPDVVERMTSLGISVVGGGPEKVTEQIKTDLDHLGPVISGLGIRAD